MLEEPIEIVSNRKIASDTCLLKLRSVELATESKPGQFVMVRVDNTTTDPLLRRPFSICDSDHNEFIKILYRIVGKGTRRLSNKRSGEVLSILGPLGSEFKFPDAGQKSILVAGGIGIAPIFFLGKSMRVDSFDFMAGYRTAEEIIEPEDIGKRSFKISVSTDDGSFGYSGRVTDLLEETLMRYEDPPHSIYACGPLPMLKQAVLAARRYDIACQVSMETFMACGLGVCQGCIVKANSVESGSAYRRICKEGPVFDANEIDWTSL